MSNAVVCAVGRVDRPGSYCALPHHLAHAARGVSHLTVQQHRQQPRQSLAAMTGASGTATTPTHGVRTRMAATATNTKTKTSPPLVRWFAVLCTGCTKHALFETMHR